MHIDHVGLAIGIYLRVCMCVCVKPPIMSCLDQCAFDCIISSVA